MRPGDLPLSEARFFVDEDLSGLGLALMRLRRDVVLGGRPPADALLPKDDPDWIPVAARLGLVVIINDRRIRTRPGEQIWQGIWACDVSNYDHG